jgi:hypothetical protein
MAWLMKRVAPPGSGPWALNTPDPGGGRQRHRRPAGRRLGLPLDHAAAGPHGHAAGLPGRPSWLYRRSGFHPLANPVALAVIALGALLWATGTPYATYFEGAQFVHFLLGPATVALAVPLFEQLRASNACGCPCWARWWWARWPPRSAPSASAGRWAPARPPSPRWRPSRSPRRWPWALPRRSAACPR